jgi:DNA excision repair protein ERCC-2
LNPEEFFRKAGLKPRPLQLEAAKQLAEMLESESNIGFEAPPGFGKTLSVLASVYAKRLFPILWRVRSYDLASRIAEDCALAGLTFYIAAGRDRTCPLVTEYKNHVHFYCRFMKYKCPYFKAITTLPDAFTYKELINFKESCPYYIQSLLKRDVIITPYNVGLYFDVNLEIIDEAHNAIIVESFPVAKFREALKELSLDFHGTIFNPRYLLDVGTSRLLEILEKGGMTFTAASVLLKLQGGIKAWIEDDEVHVLKIYKPKQRAVYVSATLMPIQQLLKIPVIRIEPTKLPAIVTLWVTSRFKDFDVIMAKNYNDIIFLLRKHFRKILVFATSRVASLLYRNYDDENPPNDKESWEGVYLLLSRGKKSEGVNLNAEAVFLAGASYPPPTVDLSGFGITNDNLVTIVAIQNIGRARRSPNAKPLVILGDERFSKRLKHNLEVYLNIQEADDLQTLDRLIRQQYVNLSNKK